MKKKEVIDTLFAGLSKELKPLKFRSSKKASAFVRRVGDTSHVLLIGVYDYHPMYQVSFHLGIRLDEVEDVFHQYSDALPEYRSQSLTSSTAFRWLSGDDVDTYEVRSSSELDAVVRRFCAVYGKNGESFFEQYGSSDALTSVLLSHDDFSTIVSPYNYMRLLILVKRTSKGGYEAVKRKAMAACAHLHPMEKSRLFALVNSLG